MSNLAISARTRRAAKQESGIRWYDPETDHEHFSRPVGVTDLLDAGADPDAPEETRLVDHVAIEPYRGPGGDWRGKVKRTSLRVLRDGERITMLATKQAVTSEVFDDREDAVAYCEGEAPVYADADLRDVTEER
ncbi:hypothetical protein [Halomarina oriensis]|uniref:Uncharacterized protein n=1 Tax=Halomarina oriensis TaxID=671145 RepID=A0A6B0GNN3_9EURY|nr:hypothetical protein [Halomarina oriensis]MWG36536.1 hypothetical protein [Halomarina oriensis]